VLAVAGSAIACRALSAAQNAEAASKKSLLAMEERLHQLDLRLVTPDKSVRFQSEGGSVRLSADDMNTRLDRLEKIISGTGLDRLSDTGKVNPEFMARVYDKYQRATSIDKHRQALVQRNRDLHRTDLDKYGKAIEALYTKARSNDSGKSDKAAEQEGNQAFTAMVEQYPNANATGMVLAERGLESALALNASEVKQCYDTLRNNENFANIVVDSGIEAVPALETYLVHDYIQNGRLDEAQALVEDMLKNFGDSIIPERSPDSDQETWRPVAEVAADLGKQIQVLSSSQVPGGTTGTGGASSGNPPSGGKR
jgi:hypothetical protein